MIEFIRDWPQQMEIAWARAKKFDIPGDWPEIKNIVITGLGGSAQSGDLVKALAKEHSLSPIEIIRDYKLPNYVDKNTLVITASYSGNTEEALSAYDDAKAKGANIVVVASGGKLSELAQKNKNPLLKIDYQAQPRAALSHSLPYLAAILSKGGFLEVDDADVAGTAERLKREIDEMENKAMAVAEKIYGKIPVVYGSAALGAVAFRVKAQFNENSKSASYLEILPELNHNSVVGTEFPEGLGSKIFVLDLESSFDHPRNRVRHQLVRDLLDKRKIGFESINMSGRSPFEELAATIVYTDFISYFLAELNKVDPVSVEIIDWLKGELANAKS